MRLYGRKAATCWVRQELQRERKLLLQEGKQNKAGVATNSAAQVLREIAEHRKTCVVCQGMQNQFLQGKL